MASLRRTFCTEAPLFGNTVAGSWNGKVKEPIIVGKKNVYNFAWIVLLKSK